MRSVLVLSRLIYLGVSYLWDCGFRGRRNEQGLERFAVRLRQTMLELGGVYIKLGQLLSTRPDLVEPVIARELEALLDKCPPEPLEFSLLTMRENLGLGSHDPLPFEVLGEVSSASFGCVYKLRFPSGQVFAMKVMRRGIPRKPATTCGCSAGSPPCSTSSPSPSATAPPTGSTSCANGPPRSSTIASKPAR